MLNITRAEQNPPEVLLTIPRKRNNNNYDKHRIAGTRDKHLLQLYPDGYEFTRRNEYDGFGFIDKLKVSRPVRSYSFNTLEMNEILTSNIEDDDNDYNEPPRKKRKTEGNESTTPIRNVQCVVQEKCKPSEARFQVDLFKKKLSSLNYTPIDDTLMNLLRYNLPEKLYTDILKHLDYHQVRWYIDQSKPFLRRLAFHRYKLDAFNLELYPNSKDLIPQIMYEVAKEIRLGRDDDLWVASLYPGQQNSGIAKRFRVKEGIYSWHVAASFTNMKYNIDNSKCHNCIAMFKSLQTMIDENQEYTLLGSRIKVLLRDGSEHEHVNFTYASPYCDDKTVADEPDYSIHLWTDSLDNRWLVDLKTSDGEPLKAEDYNRLIENHHNLIFKDPVKFFATPKVATKLDFGIVALTSDRTGETLGYLVQDEQFRLRVPYGSENPHIVGLDFLPKSLYKETCAINQYVTHVRKHELPVEIDLIGNQIASLIQALVNLPVPNEDEIRRELEEKQIKCRRLIQMDHEKDYSLIRTDCKNERENDVIHIHETYEERHFEFCTKYVFNALGKTLSNDVLKRNAKLMFKECSHFDKQNQNNVYTTHIINPDKLRMVYACICKNTMEDDGE